MSRSARTIHMWKSVNGASCRADYINHPSTLHSCILIVPLVREWRRSLAMLPMDALDLFFFLFLLRKKPYMSALFAIAAISADS